MSNLIKKENINICPSFQKSEIEIVKNSLTKRLLNLTEKEVFMELSESISNAILVVGNKSLNSTDVSIIIQQISAYLKENNQYDKIGEIKQAIKLGSFGKFLGENDVLFITPAIVIRWIKKYKEEIRDTMAKQMKFESEMKRKEEEKENESLAKKKYWEDLPKNINNCSLELSEKSKMASIYFENLWKLGLLRLDDQEIKVLKEKSIEEAKRRLREEKKNLIRIGDDNIKSISNKIAKEKAFYLWIEENRANDIEKIVTDKLKEKKII